MHGFDATMTARPGLGDRVVDLLLAAPALPHPDCLVFLVSRSAGDPDVIHLVEGWTSREAHSAFFATAAAQALLADLPLVPMLDATTLEQIRPYASTPVEPLLEGRRVGGHAPHRAPDDVHNLPPVQGRRW